jgi:hypothetical protein
MSEWTFSLILVTDSPRPSREFDYTLADELYEHGCDDATFSVRDGVPIADFDREAGDAAAAIWTAVQDVESVNNLRVHHVEPGDLVSVAQLAERTGRSRQSIQQLAAGARGPGTFPTPISGVTERTRLWRWSEVITWWSATYPLELAPAVADLASAIVEVNETLEAGPRSASVDHARPPVSGSRRRPAR